MGLTKQRQHKLCVTLLVSYVLALLCAAIVIRTPVEKDFIKTDFFWGYHSNEQIIFWDNVYNICAFIPLGILVGLCVPQYKILAAGSLGLFISETIECSQLIWKLGAFDVDDLFNNTIGSLAGGLIAVLVIWFLKMVKRQPISL